MTSLLRILIPGALLFAPFFVLIVSARTAGASGIPTYAAFLLLAGIAGAAGFYFLRRAQEEHPVDEVVIATVHEKGDERALSSRRTARRRQGRRRGSRSVQDRPEEVG